MLNDLDAAKVTSVILTKTNQGANCVSASVARERVGSKREYVTCARVDEPNVGGDELDARSDEPQAIRGQSEALLRDVEAL